MGVFVSGCVEGGWMGWICSGCVCAGYGYVGYVYSPRIHVSTELPFEATVGGSYGLVCLEIYYAF